MYAIGGASSASASSRRIRASNWVAPDSVVSVSVRIDSIGTRWTTGANSAARAPLTRCVGESAVTSAGYADSMASSSRNNASYSASLTVGASFS